VETATRAWTPRARSIEYRVSSIEYREGEGEESVVDLVDRRIRRRRMKRPNLVVESAESADSGTENGRGRRVACPIPSPLRLSEAKPSPALLPLIVSFSEKSKTESRKDERSRTADARQITSPALIVRRDGMQKLVRGGTKRNSRDVARECRVNSEDRFAKNTSFFSNSDVYLVSVS